ncbi:MAG: hypothetical protein ABR599_07165 [Gemmatimonadota bacterium]
MNRSLWMTGLLLGLGVGACDGGPDEGGQPAVEVADTDTTVALEPAPVDTAAADTTAGEWCSYASATDVGSVLGTGMRAPEESHLAANRGNCTYGAADPAAGKSATVQFFPSAEYDATVNASGRDEQVSGLGEEAWQTSDGGLLVRTARPFSFSVYAVDVSGGSVQELRDAERALAGKVLAGL